MLLHSVRLRVMSERRPRRHGALLAVMATVAAVLPITAPLRASAITLTTSELWGERNPGETGTTFLGRNLPVNPDTGNLVVQATDLSVSGRGRGLVVARTYNAQAAAQASVPDALGYGWSFTYGRHLSVDSVTGAVTVFDANGSTVTFTPAAGGGFTAPAQVIATLVHNADGTYTCTLPDQTSETFSAAGVLQAESDRNHYNSTLGYTAGKLTTVTDASGRALTISYDTQGRLATITDPASRTVTYGYDAASNLASVTDVASGLSQYGYDAAHRLSTLTDAGGGVTTYTYDSAGRVATITDPAGRGRQIRYGPGTATVIDDMGRQVVYQYSGHLLASVTRGFGTGVATTEAYTYDTAGNRTGVTDGRGGQWTATYDSRGNRLTATDPTSRTVSWVYNGFNEPTSITDPAGVPTSYYYDTFGNLTGVSRQLVAPLQPTQTASISYSYDSAHPGDMVGYTDPRSRTWTFTRDPATGDLLSVADPNHHTTSATYNRIGWVMTSTSARGNASATPAAYTTTVTRNAFGDPLTVTDPMGGVWTTTYDPMRRVSTLADPVHDTTTWRYDEAGNVVRVIRADTAVWRTTYNAAGDVETQSDGLGHRTTFTYDAVDRLATVLDPLQRLTSISYDSNDNRALLLDAMGRTTQFTYDGANRLSTVINGSGASASTVTSYTYDRNGRMETMTDATHVSSWAYDTLGRLTSSTNGAAQAVQYSWDIAGRLATITYPALRVVSAAGTQTTIASPGSVSRSYDESNRLLTVTDFSGQHVTTYGYDADGNLASAILPNQVTETMAYDNADRLAGTTVTNPQGVALFSLPVTRNAAGLITSASPTGAPNAPTETYTYDAQLRLATASPTVATLPARGYGYDVADELTSIATGAAATQLTYDPAGQLSNAVAQPAGVVTGTYAYDGRGERIQFSDSAGNASTYEWDQAGRMTGFRGPVVETVNGQTSRTIKQATFTYDGNGLRQSKLVSDQAALETFVYDVAQGRSLMIADGTMSYVTGVGGYPVEQVNAAGTVLYYVTDQSGSTRLLTDQAGRVVQAYTYDHDGKATPSVPSLVQPFQFGGAFADVETGFLLVDGRYYDPATGQFVSRAAPSTGPQRAYVAAGDDPLNAPLSSVSGAPAAAPVPCVGPQFSSATTPWGDAQRDACGRVGTLATALFGPVPGLLP